MSADALVAGNSVPAELRVLDIGCGTGLATEAVLNTPLGRRVVEVDLLDTSPGMLARCRERAARWNLPHHLIEGELADLPADRSYNLVIICSVLHHIADVSAFLRDVGQRQMAGGLFLHMQDPNGDYLHDPELVERVRAVQAVTRPRTPRWLRRLAPGRVMGRLYRAITHTQPTDYIDSVNTQLLQTGIITVPMTAPELWSVTDLHVDNLPFSQGDGISIQGLRRDLADYTPLSLRTYAFFGEMLSDLPPAFQAQEESLITARAMNGKYLAGLWQRHAEQD